MDLFDELFDGAKPKSKAKAKAAPRLDLNDAIMDAIAQEEQMKDEKNNNDNKSTRTKRPREQDDVDEGPPSKKAKVKAAVLSLDDSDELEVMAPQAKAKGPGQGKGQAQGKKADDADLKALLRDADALVGPVAPTLPKQPSASSAAQLNALASLHRSGERAAGLRAKLRETAVMGDGAEARGTKASEDERSLRVTVVDEAHGRRIVLPVLPQWTGAQLRPLVARSLNLDEARCVLTYLGIPVDTRSLRDLQVDDGDELLVKLAAPVKDDVDQDVARRVQALTQQMPTEEKDEEEDDPDSIRLKIRVEKQSIAVALKKSDPFSKVLNALRVKFQVPEDGKVALTLDGERLESGDTPEDMDLEDGDQLDAFITLPQEGMHTRGRR